MNDRVDAEPGPAPRDQPPMADTGEMAESVDDGELRDSPWPSVSVVVPVLDEGRHLADAVARILDQDYPGELDVTLALGPSTDDTDAVAAALTGAHPRVRTVPNPTGKTPVGLNTAIAASSGEIVVRVDGHAEIRCTTCARPSPPCGATSADNVGIMDAQRSPVRTGGRRRDARAHRRRTRPFHVEASPVQRTPSTSGCSVGPRWLESAASTSTFNAPRTGR